MCESSSKSIITGTSLKRSKAGIVETSHRIGSLDCTFEISIDTLSPWEAERLVVGVDDLAVVALEGSFVCVVWGEGILTDTLSGDALVGPIKCRTLTI